MIVATQNPCLGSFEYLVESFICYKSGDPALEQ